MRGGLVLLLAVGCATGCFKVAEAPPREMEKLSGHRQGRPPVEIRTLNGETVKIDGDFKEVRVITGDSWHERIAVVRPPFVAEKTGETLEYRSASSGSGSIDAAEANRVEIVQRDGGRTATVLGVGFGAMLVGAVLGGYIDYQSRDRQQGDTVCGLCGAAAGMIVVGGLGFLIVVPLTKYY